MALQWSVNLRHGLTLVSQREPGPSITVRYNDIVNAVHHKFPNANSALALKAGHCSLTPG